MDMHLERSSKTSAGTEGMHHHPTSIEGPVLQEYFSRRVVDMHFTHACTIFEILFLFVLGLF